MSLHKQSRFIISDHAQGEKRHPPLDIGHVSKLFDSDITAGKLFWKDVAKQHARLNGKEAGFAKVSRGGKFYWAVKINGIAYLRSHIIFLLKTGNWPNEQVDHENGNSLDDRASNLRAATQTQNAWNHRTRKKIGNLPMGIRKLGQKYQARISHNNKMVYLGVFCSVEDAHLAYLSKRKELFGEYSGVA